MITLKKTNPADCEYYLNGILSAGERHSESVSMHNRKAGTVPVCLQYLGAGFGSLDQHARLLPELNEAAITADMQQWPLAAGNDYDSSVVVFATPPMSDQEPWRFAVRQLGEDGQVISLDSDFDVEINAGSNSPPSPAGAYDLTSTIVIDEPVLISSAVSPSFVAAVQALANLDSKAE